MSLLIVTILDHNCRYWIVVVWLNLGNNSSSFRSFQSFETELHIEAADLEPSRQCHGVFIRAPAIVQVLSPDVEVLATLNEDQCPGSSVGIAQ